MSILYYGLVLGSKPKAYYRMNEISGTTLNDTSPNALNGSISAAGVTYSQAGTIAGDANHALLFNGTTGDASGPAGLSPAGWSAITVECWVNLSNTTYAGSPSFVAQDNPQTTNVGFKLQVNANGTRNTVWWIGNGTTHASANAGNTMAAATWYHIVGTWDGAIMRLYINGAQVQTATISGTIGTSAGNVGIAWDGTGSFLPGLLDEVAIYNSVLSPTTILEHYNVGLQAQGGAGLYLITQGSTLLAQDVNQALAILQQPAGGQETGKYYLSGNLYTAGAFIGVYIYSLSRVSVPVSVSIDTTDTAPTNINAPATSVLTHSGFDVGANCAALTPSGNAGGGYTITY